MKWPHVKDYFYHMALKSQIFEFCFCRNVYRVVLYSLVDFCPNPLFSLVGGAPERANSLNKYLVKIADLR